MAEHTDTGASPRELLIESSRRNNTALFTDLLHSKPLASNKSSIAQFLNNTTDALGASALHIAATYGSYDVLDLILDQEGVEIDGKEKREGDTALHCAVRFCNERAAPRGEGQLGLAVVEILLDAGCDPRIRNKAKLRPIDLAEPRNADLRKALQKAELVMTAGDDVVDEDEDDDAGHGSESD